MWQSIRAGKFVATIVAGGAPFLVTLGAWGQQATPPRVQRPQSTEGARSVGVETPANRGNQNTKAAGGTVKQTADARPENGGPAAKENDPATLPQSLQMPKELDKILGDWERHTAQLKRLQGDFTLYKYDSVFETETRADGTFWYASPDKGRMDLLKPNPKSLTRNADKQPVSTKTNAKGVPFQFKEKDPETWVCTGKLIRQFNHGSADNGEKTYSEVTIPEQFQGEGIRNSPLPFLFGLKKEEAKSRYVLNLGSKHNSVVKGSKAPIIHIVAHPLHERDSREWSRAEILLHSDTFLPYAIRTLDPANSGETVYSFKTITPNVRWLIDDPFNVTTFGYKKLVQEDFDPQIAPVQPAAGNNSRLKLFDKPKEANPFSKDKADQ
jgi:TIGR03009 family protein